MAQIRKNPDGGTDRVVIEYHPSEILNKVVYAPSIDKANHPRQAEKIEKTGYLIEDAIRLAAWRDLCVNAPKIVKATRFLFGKVEVLEGKIVASFFTDRPQVLDPPGG